MVDIPHWAFPMVLGPDGAFATVEQDLDDEVKQAVFLVSRTEIGSRPLAPDFGVDDPTFVGVDAEALTATLEAQESRASVTVTVTGPDETGEEDVLIEVALAADAVT